MLFNYRYIPHKIEGLQTWLDHLVKNVWVNAAGDFDVNMLHDDLRAVVLKIYNIEEEKTRGNAGDWLYGPIKKIFNLFKMLSACDRQRVSDWYDNNNDIEALCACDPLKLPATYADIHVFNADLAKELETFCKGLWSNVLSLAPVEQLIGEIRDHYLEFVNENNGGRCPYCGYGDIKGVHHAKREAYDHYLPKDIYPFNTVNFRNLAPMCHECNSTYKLKTDPTRNLDPITRKPNGTRRKAFYSYSTVNSGITVSVILNTKDVTNLIPADIELQITAPGRDEEVEAWMDVFGIDERYKARLCGENDGKGWLTQVEDECHNYNLTPQEMLEAEIRSAEKKPWIDENFLKRPFLIACQNAKIV